MNSNRRIVTPKWQSNPSPVAEAPPKKLTRAEREAAWDAGAEQRSERRAEQSAEAWLCRSYDD